MGALNTRERLEARQAWLELGLRETWQVEGQSIGSLGSPRYYILQDGKVREADFPAWAAWAYTRLPDRLIRHTVIENNVSVDTVFLAFNQGCIGDGPPLLFETFVQGGPLSGKNVRYTTMDAAVAGHDAMVEHVKEGSLMTALITL
jgi:hypothetical protein